jgi:hypothetical protein
MIDNVKTIVIVGVSALIVGAVGTAILLPTKIETKVETKVEIKEVEKRIIIDREITKVTKPDGTVTEITKEKDRSKEESKDIVNELKTNTTMTNPKNTRFAVKTLIDLNKELNLTSPNVGIGVQIDITPSIFVEVGAFKDKQIEVGIGFSL